MVCYDYQVYPRVLVVVIFPLVFLGGEKNAPNDRALSILAMLSLMSRAADKVVLGVPFISLFVAGMGGGDPLIFFANTAGDDSLTILFAAGDDSRNTLFVATTAVGVDCAVFEPLVCIRVRLCFVCCRA